MRGPPEPGATHEPGRPTGPEDGTAVAEEPSLASGARDPRPGRRFSTRAKVACAALGVLAAGALVLAYRGYQERRIVAMSVARATKLVRADTWLGYHEAASLLALRAATVDPLEAGSLRAFALAMLSLDYRDRGAATDANEALVEPARASTMPVYAQLAVATMALGEGRAGTALEYATRAGDDAVPLLLYARVALLAGNASLARDTLDRALTADPELPAALALNGDLLRRSGRAADASQAYVAALASSSRALEGGLSGSSVRAGAVAPHARATFGLAKLALSREIAPEVATGPLQRLLDDRTGTPQVERARAAMFLAAIQGRAGERGQARETLYKAGVDEALHAWLEKASGQLEVERGRYRVPDGTPAVLLSASDDDPYVPPPPPPPAAPAAPKPALHGFKVHPAASKKTGAKPGGRSKKTPAKKARAKRATRAASR